MAIKTPCLFCGMRIVLVAQEWQHVATGSRFCSVLDSDNRQATPAGDDQTVVNDLANRYEAAMHRIDELENDLRIANEASLVLLTRTAELEDHLAAALDVIIAVENKADDAALEDLQVRLDDMAKPYSERRLVVRRRPEYGWAVWDKDTGEKLRPVNPNQWFRDRKTALAAKATEQPPMGVK